MGGVELGKSILINNYRFAFGINGFCAWVDKAKNKKNAKRQYFAGMGSFFC